MMLFSVAIPTCVEGLLFPVPYVTPERLMRIAKASEDLGYHSVWGNDHLTTQDYVKDEWADAPNYYEPLVTLAFVAAATKRIRLGTSIIVIAMREPVLLAKQIATLDQFSGGRLMIGIGVGAYREEFERVRPDVHHANRGEMVEEGIQALRQQWTERTATHQGKYYHFEEIESYPKPVQDPLPIYVGGNTVDAARRAGKYGQGWLPAVLPLDQFADRMDILRRSAEEAGRDPGTLDIAPQFSVSVAHTHEKALESFRGSQMYQHLLSLRKSTLKDVDTSSIEKFNLVGTPDSIAEQISAYGKLGATHMCSLIFGSRTIEDSLEQMEFFAKEVMPKFS
jgi:probable F420-dependent oxidoreductase